MRFLTTQLLAAASSFSLCLAAPRSSSHHVLHEKRNVEPHQWSKRDRAVGHETLPIRIGLRQRNLEHGARFLDDISDPDSPNFGTIMMIVPLIRAIPADNTIF